MADINGSDMVVTVNGKQLNNVDCATLLGVEIKANCHLLNILRKYVKRWPLESQYC